MNKLNEDDFLGAYEDFLKDAPPEDREARLKRVKGLWGKYTGEDDVVSFKELEETMRNEVPAVKIGTKYGSLDKLIDGFRYEQLIVLSAQEKTGKTSFAIELVDSMKDQNPCYFLFEQSAQEIIRQRRERGQDVPHGYAPKKNVDNRWEWIEKRMMESMVKYGTRVFVIDNVDWLEKEYGYNQRTDEVMRDLLLKVKNFCKQWEVIIFLIAHVKKVPMDVIPQPDDIKDTSAFKQIADIVLILWRKTKEEKVQGTKTKAPYRTNETLLWVAENRQTGKTGYVQFIFDGRNFIEKTWDEGLMATEQFNQHAESF
jgi:replicative DNA helicase